jgi:hypothetical protein
VGDLRRDVRRVTEAAAQLDNLATDARVIGADTKLRNVKVGLWLPYQAKDGAHLISASQEQRDNVKHARTGGDRMTVWDGESRAYITFKVIADLVLDSTCGGLKVGETEGTAIYWNAAAYATWSSADAHDLNILSMDRDLLPFLESAKQVAEVVATIQSAEYLGVEIQFLGPVFTPKDGKEDAKAITKRPLKASVRQFFRQSRYSELDAADLVKRLETDAIDAPQRCVVDTLMEQYGAKIRQLQARHWAGR